MLGPASVTRAVRRVAVAVITTVCALAASAPVAVAADFTWTGAADNDNWSTDANWTTAAPSGSVGTLTFPALAPNSCTNTPPTESSWLCHSSLYNHPPGIAANALSVHLPTRYGLSSQQILKLGAGGLTTTGGSGRLQLGMPIELTAAQTWTVTGGRVDVYGVVPSNAAWAVSLPNGGALHLHEFGSTSNIDVGNVTVDGNGARGSLVVSHRVQLNATSGNPVTIGAAASLDAIGVDTGIGPLTVSGAGSRLLVGDRGFGSQAGGPGGGRILTVGGALALGAGSTFTPYWNGAGETAGSDSSQVSASGNVSLSNTTLNLTGATTIDQGKPACATLQVGDVATLLRTTGGSLTGTFNSVPDGATVPVACPADREAGVGEEPTVRINYTPTAVTATVLTAGSSVIRSTTTTVKLEKTQVLAGDFVMLTATVSSPNSTPHGSVVFAINRKRVRLCDNPTPPVDQGQAKCSTWFEATDSPGSVTATFVPGSGSYRGSTSAPQTLTISKRPTSLEMPPGGGNGLLCTVEKFSNRVLAFGHCPEFRSWAGLRGLPNVGGGLKPSVGLQWIIDGAPAAGQRLLNGAPVGGCNGTMAGVDGTAINCDVHGICGRPHTLWVVFPGDANFLPTRSPDIAVPRMPCPGTLAFEPVVRPPAALLPNPPVSAAAARAALKNVQKEMESSLRQAKSSVAKALKKKTVSSFTVKFRSPGSGGKYGVASSGKFELTLYALVRGKKGKKARRVAIGSGEFDRPLRCFIPYPDGPKLDKTLCPLGGKWVVVKVTLNFAGQSMLRKAARRRAPVKMALLSEFTFAKQSTEEELALTVRPR